MIHTHAAHHSLSATIHNLLDRLPALQHKTVPPTRGPGNIADPAAVARTSRATRLTAEQREVLQAVADRQIHRDLLLGSLEPHLLNGHDVIWTLRALVIRGLVQLQPIGAPHLTTRGHRALNSR